MSRHDDVMRIRRHIPINHPAYKTYESQVLNDVADDLQGEQHCDCCPNERDPDWVDAAVAAFCGVAGVAVAIFILFVAFHLALWATRLVTGWF